MNVLLGFHIDIPHHSLCYANRIYANDLARPSRDRKPTLKLTEIDSNRELHIKKAVKQSQPIIECKIILRSCIINQ